MSSPAVPESGLPVPDKMPPSYAQAVPDRRTPLMAAGEMLGVFSNPAAAAETKRFLANAPWTPKK